MKLLPPEESSHAGNPAESSEPRLLTRSLSDNSSKDAEQPRKKKHKLRSRMLLTAGALLALLVVAGFVTALYLRHSMRAALPQLDGTLNVPGLGAPVTVTRDEHGVPSLQAATLDDLLFAQGFVVAQDRLWQMDALRRHAAGELAEVLGSKLIAHDRTQRYLQLRAAADRAIGTLPPDQLHQLEAYARGVNAFITQNSDHLPVEFHILNYKPAPWTPRDSLLVSLAMAQDLSTEFPTKLTREALGQHLAPELMADLYPVGSWRDHPPGQSTPDLTSPRPEIDQIPLDDSQSRITPSNSSPDDLLAAQASMLQETCEGCRSGSNNWAVAGSRSASGKPLVSNDMHLLLGIPDIWYETSLHATDGSLDVTGLTLPGTPFVIVGRNAHVAWGFTNLGADVQDVYIEHLRGTGSSTEFQKSDGSWTLVAHHAERIRVHHGNDVTLDVQTTTHSIGTVQIETPIITPLFPSERRTLSLAWTIYDPANVSEPFLAANTAATGNVLVAAFSNFGGPSLNLVYADDQNHIGYHALGRIPIRGPAVHHPVTPAPVIPQGDTGETPPNDDDASANDTSTPGTHAGSLRDSQPPRPMLSTIAYRPQRRSGVPSLKAKKPLPRPAQPITPKLEDADIPPLPTLLDYTIGSPIPATPADALDLTAQWSGYIPYAELPMIVDPPDGFLATANARISAKDYPYALALNWASPYRVERITHVLAGRTGLTPADMLKLQMDVHSEFDLALAHRIAYALDQSGAGTGKSSNAKRLHQAADILRNWNGDVDAGAAAPSIIAATRAQLLPMILTAQIAKHDAAFHTSGGTKPEAVAHLYSWGEQGYALEQLVLHAPARWLPPGVADWNDLLTTAVERGLADAKAPTDLAMWSFGMTHPVEFDHPLLSATPLFGLVLGVHPGSGPLVIGGDTSTVKATSRSFGPTERFTADLGSADATTSNITTGQSGNPASPWYLDQLPAWLGGTTLPMPLHGNPATHTLTLTP